MNYFLLNLKLNGIKNIEKEIEIDFYKKDLKNFSPINYNVKGIFGPNGIGKTAILKSIEIIKNIVINNYYLTDSENLNLLHKLINKNTKKMNVEITFLNFNNKKNDKKYIYYVELEIKHNDIFISKESIKTENKSKELIIELGQILNNSLFENSALIEDISKNLLNKRSILNIIKAFEKDNLLKDNDKETFVNLFNFFKNLYIKTDNYQYNMLDIINLMDIDDKYDMRIPKKKGTLEILKKDFERKTKFLKLFKKDLSSISFEKKDDGVYYYLNIFFNYNNLEISYSFESQGIKLLFILHSYLDKILNGGIVLIDEIDSSIHDVYLNKIIEFFSEEGKGQLIFTSHNTTLLNTLRKYNNSIDFINENIEIVPWIKNGNSSAFNKYREGYIKGLPFNIVESDFYEIFSNEEGV
ncbi:AAA family ATPase [Fusobacterium polymorphum]|uniref:AAA family ATPase n=1 Tax=Fusobacterium nucleatum subsp. polymorphum TaxID=76857 RepID=UPI00300A9FB6